MTFAGEELLKKEIKLAEDKAQEIRKITAEQIKDLANKIFTEKTLNLALIGPFKEKTKFVKILKF